MIVGQVIEIAKEYVEKEASQAPGFCGAYLAGAINRMPKEATFPLYRDVDVYVPVEDVKQIPVPQRKLLYKGVILECVYGNFEEYSSPEAVLSDPGKASNLVGGNILSDPTGFLGKLYQAAVKEYAQRRWVQARCEVEKKGALERLGKEEIERLDLWWVVLYLGGLIAVAHLMSPTVRRCLALTKELLQKQGKLELHFDEGNFDGWRLSKARKISNGSG